MRKKMFLLEVQLLSKGYPPAPLPLCLREAAKKILLFMAGPLTLKGYFTNEKDGGGGAIMAPTFF